MVGLIGKENCCLILHIGLIAIGLNVFESARATHPNLKFYLMCCRSTVIRERDLPFEEPVSLPSIYNLPWRRIALAGAIRETVSV